MNEPDADESFDLFAELDDLLHQYLTQRNQRAAKGVGVVESDGPFAVALAIRCLAQVVESKSQSMIETLAGGFATRELRE